MICHFSRKLTLLLVASIVLFACSGSRQADPGAQTAQASQIQQKVESKNFVLNITRASTSRGRTINLTGTYTISLSGDKFTCDLPYYGQSYAGSGYGGSGPVAFTSTNFSVGLTAAKKGGWDVEVKFNDQQDVRSALLFLSKSGYATANFTFQNRSPMEYSGTVAMP